MEANPLTDTIPTDGFAATAGDETYVTDYRTESRPSQQVDAKLATMLNTSLPVSSLRNLRKVRN